MMDMLLVIYARDDDPAARNIRSRSRLNTIGEDSTLRAQSQYRQGIVDALQLIIQAE
jgi:hypothetical protein